MNHAASLVLLLAIGCERAALPTTDSPQQEASCVVVAPCPTTDPQHGLPWGGEMAACDVDLTMPDGHRAACYVGLGPDAGVCQPADATVHYYNPEPPIGYVVAASCDECQRLAGCK